MFPTLFHLGTGADRYPVSTWAFMAVLGSVVGVAVGMAVARRGRPDLVDGFTPDRRLLWELALVVILGGWLSAKLFHVLFEAEGHLLLDGSVATSVWDLLKDDPLHMLRLSEGGYVFYGGPVGAVALTLLYLQRQGLLRMQVVGLLMDAGATALAAGIVVGRLGCFLGGCCYGSPTDAWWAIHFPAGHPTSGHGVHPTQLFDAGAGFLIFGATLALNRIPRLSALPFFKRPGSIFVVLAVGYAVARFITEGLRADADRGTIGPLSTSQAISLLVVAAALVFVAWLKRGSPPEERP